MWESFRKFAIRGNVMDLAVGVIVGAAFTNIVNSLVNDILMPPLGFILGHIDFSNFFINLSALTGESRIHFATLDEAHKAGVVTINYGLFLNNVIKFLITAFAVFLLIREINKLFVRQQESAATPPQEALLAEIRDLLKADLEAKRDVPKG